MTTVLSTRSGCWLAARLVVTFLLHTASSGAPPTLLSLDYVPASGSTATASLLYGIGGVAHNPGSNGAYISSGSAVYFINFLTNTLLTVVSPSNACSYVEGGPAISSCLSSCSGASCQRAWMPLAYDATRGTLVVAGGAPAVVAIDVASGTVSTLAGACYNSSSSCRVPPWEGAPAVPACLCTTGGVAVDALTGDTFFVSEGRRFNRVLALRKGSQTLSVVAGAATGGPSALWLTSVSGLAIDPIGRRLVIADYGYGRICTLPLSGGNLTSIGGNGGGNPTAVAVNPASGDVYFALAGSFTLFVLAQGGGGRAREVPLPGLGNATSRVTRETCNASLACGITALTFGAGGALPRSLLIGTANEFGWGAALAAPVTDSGLGPEALWAGGRARAAVDGQPLSSLALLSSAHTDVAVHPRTGDVAILDAVGQRILLVNASSWLVTVVAGIGPCTTNSILPTGGTAPAVSACLPSSALALAFDGASGDIVFASDAHVWRVSAATGALSRIAGSSDDSLDFSTTTTTSSTEVSVAAPDGDGGPATLARVLPRGCAVSPVTGDVVFSDRWSHAIRVIDARTGNISTLAGTGTDAIPRDGGPASLASLSQPGRVTVSARGDVAFMDAGLLLFVSAASDNISLLATNAPSCPPSYYHPLPVTFNASSASGDLLFIDCDAVIYLLAGGTQAPVALAAAAAIPTPMGIATDAAGNLLVVGATGMYVALTAATVACPPGFACPAGAPEPCMDPAKFCPRGTRFPLPPSPAYAPVADAQGLFSSQVRSDAVGDESFPVNQSLVCAGALPSRVLLYRRHGKGVPGRDAGTLCGAGLERGLCSVPAVVILAPRRGCRARMPSLPARKH